MGLLLIPQLAGAATYKDWVEFTYKDLITDEVRYGAKTTALNRDFPYQPRLFVFCENGEGFRAYISEMGYYPSSKAPFDVTIRADKNKPKLERWDSLNSNKGVWNSEAAGLVLTLKAANSLIIRSESGIGEPDTWKFSAAGFTKAISKAERQCGSASKAVAKAKAKG